MTRRIPTNDFYWRCFFFLSSHFAAFVYVLLVARTRLSRVHLAVSVPKMVWLQSYLCYQKKPENGRNVPALRTSALWADLYARWLIGDWHCIFSITLFLMKYTEWKTFFCIFSDVMKLFIPNIESFLLNYKLLELRIQNKRNLKKSSEKYC